MVAPPSSVLKVAAPAPESTPQENFPFDEFHKRVSDSVLQLDIPAKAEPTKAETEAVPTSSSLLSGELVPMPIFPLEPLIKNFPSPISRFLLFKATSQLVSKVAEATISSKSIEFDDTPPLPQEKTLPVVSHLSDCVPPSQSVNPAPSN